MLNLATIPTRNPDVIGRVVDDETVLVMPKKGQVKVLNEVGTVIWGMVDGKRTINQIIDKICADFEVDRDAAEKDTVRFIADLLDRELIINSPN